MAELLVLVDFQGAPPSAWEPASGAEREGDGFIGGSLWVGVGEAETALGLLHFADEAASADHLRQRVEASGDGLRASALPSTVHHVYLESRHGQRLEASAVGSYLTTLHILASPGYGEEAGARLDEGLESIEPLEGYAGHVRGTNSALEDEVWALVLWTSPPLLPHTPEDGGATISHYRRIK